MKNYLALGLLAACLLGCSNTAYKEQNQVVVTNSAGERFTLLHKGKSLGNGISEADLWYKGGNTNQVYFMQLRVRFADGTSTPPEFAPFR